MSSKTLLKVLTTPSKIASALDWKKAVGSSVMSIDIHKDRIGFAISSHPSLGDSTTALEPIRHQRGKVNPECLQGLSQLVKDHKVCGFVVSFPVQQDTGRMGAACGRVLHTLDNLLTHSNLVTPNRPLCLWDSQHSTAEQQDEWGRSAGFAGKASTTNKTLHKASTEQYNQDEAIVASQVWQDFCRVNWPDLQVQQQRTTQRSEKTSTSIDFDSLEQQHDEWEEAKVAML